MKATVKQIFAEISYLNPSVSNISSLGGYVSQSSQIVADSICSEIIGYLPKNTLAYKIITSAQKFTEKQLWVIAFELVKNDEYAEKLGDKIDERTSNLNAKTEENKAKLASNKENSQNVLDFVKSNGKLLKDYYSFVKSNKKFGREFFSKKFTMESANSFLNA